MDHTKLTEYELVVNSYRKAWNRKKDPVNKSECYEKLKTYGEAGMKELLEYFLKYGDAYDQEQILDIMVDCYGNDLFPIAKEALKRDNLLEDQMYMLLWYMECAELTNKYSLKAMYIATDLLNHKYEDVREKAQEVINVKTAFLEANNISLDVKYEPA